MRSLLAAVAALWLTGTASGVLAQDFRVYTSVADLNSQGTAPRVVARSLTLFHAGKVYDHMEEVGELVIFEPGEDQFVIIRGNVAAKAPFESLRQMLEVASTEAERHAAELQQRSEPEARRLGAQLRFQLSPDFQEQFDPATNRLTLSGTEFSYEVRTAPVDAPRMVERYLEYADWTARLNTVLHPQAMYPQPRIALNQSLRAQQTLPTQVRLQSRDPQQVNLRADHEFRWELQAIDKDLIHQWERLRQSPDMQWVSFREYQQRLIVQSRRERR
jgi:hypothetical protein